MLTPAQIAQFEALVKIAETSALQQASLRFGDVEFSFSKETAPAASTAPQPSLVLPEEVSAASATTLTAPLMEVVHVPHALTLGQVIERDQLICQIEVMKMLHDVRAEHAGLLSGVHISAGQLVQYGEALIDIEMSDAHAH